MKGQAKWVVSESGVASEERVAWWRRAWRRIRRWHQLARQRRQLASLSDAALKDIGYGRADIWMESNRPFWDDR